MSAIAAIFAREGLLNPSEIHDVTAAMAARGPDSAAIWQEGPVALGHAGLSTLPGDAKPQPAFDTASGSAFVMDGRIDARVELAAACEIDRPELDSISDAELLLRALLARGLPVLPSVLGDFAFVFWDAPRSRLVCGRDVLGLRPLFYTQTERDLVVASELQAVLRGRRGIPNAGMIAEALTCMPTSRDETLFQGVFRVPPGHLLIVDRRGMHLTRFVTLEAPAPLNYLDERDYIEHFRDILISSVRDRLRSTSNPAVMLSGGVDSSTIFAAARGLSDVNAYTVAYDDPLLDESAIAQDIVNRNGGQLHRVGTAAAGYDYAEEIQRYRDLPTYPSGANSTALRRLAKSHDVRVLLNGIGGDECFLGHAGRWADWLRAGKWLLLWRELKTWHESADPASWSALARITLQPLLPPTVRRAASALLHRGDPFPWVPRGFLQQTNLHERVRRVPDEHGPTYASTGMIRSLIDGAAIAAWEEQERLAARFQQDDRMPFLDRRAIAFALGLPETLRSKPGSPKDFVRRAWSDRLPASVMNPLAARDYAFHVVEALEANGGLARFSDLAITDLGWVDPVVVRRMAEQLFATARTSRQFMGHAARLWAVFAVDAWYRGALDLSIWPRNDSRRSERTPANLANVSTGGRR